MKSLIISLLISIPAVASADKNFMGGGSGSWDCSKDPVVNINTGNGSYTFTGSCKTINVNGGDNKLTIASVAQLNINGGTNTADCDELGAVSVAGADNKITYKRASKGDKPGVSTVGTGNSVTKGAGGAKPADKDKPADKPADKGGGDGDRAIIDCAKKPTWSTGNGDGKFKFVGACKKISVGGGKNDLYIDSVETLDVGGGQNNIFVGTVGTISVGGSGNQITWKKALKGDKPALKGQPTKNTIVQIK